MNQLIEHRQHFEISEDGHSVTFNAQLDRKVYDLCKKAFERLSGSWNKKSQAVLFGYDAREEIEEIFRTGKLPKRNPLQLFPTPREQVLDMINSTEAGNILASSRHGKKVRMLEPSIGLCGIADIVRELYPDVEIVGVELDSVNAKLAAAKGYEVITGDFLEVPIPLDESQLFDVILCNPPFLGRDFIKHVRHGQSFLRADGALASVIPSDWIKSAKKPVELDFISDASICGDSIASVYGPGTYEGTPVKTCIIELWVQSAINNYVSANEEYLIHKVCLELENDYDSMEKIKSALKVGLSDAALTVQTLMLQNTIASGCAFVPSLSASIANAIKNSILEAEESDAYSISKPSRSEQIGTQIAESTCEPLQDLSSLDHGLDQVMAVLDDIQDVICKIEDRLQVGNETKKTLQHVTKPASAVAMPKYTYVVIDNVPVRVRAAA